MVQKKGTHRGFTFIELIFVVAIFAMVAAAILATTRALTRSISYNRFRDVAIQVAAEQMEIIRNLPYDDVGTTAGFPTGVIPSNQTITRAGISFDIVTTVRNVDDPFDGTVGGSPNDLSPADYKSVDLTLSCTRCPTNPPLRFNTDIAPKGLEGDTNNGAIFVQVLDANGLPVQDASVNIVNTTVIPNLDITDTTGSDGFLRIVDLPPSTNDYEVTVTKTGYSSDQTRDSDGGNPNPTQPHLTVAASDVTQRTFAIDQLGSIDVSTLTPACVPIGSIQMDIDGSKLIGTSPDVLKYSTTQSTDGSGNLSLTNMEWDEYDFTLTGSTYDIAGYIPSEPFELNPGEAATLSLVLELHTSHTLLVDVKDTIGGLPISGVQIDLNGPTSVSQTTGLGHFRQSDWTGGSGQEDFTDETKYLSDSGTVDVSTGVGEIRLLESGGLYSLSGNLTSSTFNTGAVANFTEISWEPQSQPPETGPDSVKFQVATGSSTSTWTYVGPDNTSSTYYTTTNNDLSANHAGHQYLRYKAFLATDDDQYTPNISDVSVSFTASCTPPGQTFFKGLPSGNYSYTASKSGYESATGTVNVSGQGLLEIILEEI